MTSFSRAVSFGSGSGSTPKFTIKVPSRSPLTFDCSWLIDLNNEAGWFCCFYNAHRYGFPRIWRLGSKQTVLPIDDKSDPYSEAMLSLPSSVTSFPSVLLQERPPRKPEQSSLGKRVWWGEVLFDLLDLWTIQDSLICLNKIAPRSQAFFGGHYTKEEDRLIAKEVIHRYSRLHFGFARIECLGSIVEDLPSGWFEKFLFHNDWLMMAELSNHFV